MISRKEEGNLCFDVLRVKDSENKFIIYELYTDDDALEFHRTLGPYKAGLAFNKSGGAISVVCKKGTLTFNTSNFKIYSCLMKKKM